MGAPQVASLLITTEVMIAEVPKWAAWISKKSRHSGRGAAFFMPLRRPGISLEEHEMQTPAAMPGFCFFSL